MAHRDLPYFAFEDDLDELITVQLNSNLNRTDSKATWPMVNPDHMQFVELLETLTSPVDGYSVSSRVYDLCVTVGRYSYLTWSDIGDEDWQEFCSAVETIMDRIRGPVHDLEILGQRTSLSDARVRRLLESLPGLKSVEFSGCLESDYQETFQYLIDRAITSVSIRQDHGDEGNCPTLTTVHCRGLKTLIQRSMALNSVTLWNTIFEKEEDAVGLAKVMGTQPRLDNAEIVISPSVYRRKNAPTFLPTLTKKLEFLMSIGDIARRVANAHGIDGPREEEKRLRRALVYAAEKRDSLSCTFHYLRRSPAIFLGMIVEDKC